MRVKPNFRLLKVTLITAAAAGIVVLLSLAVLSRSPSHGLPYRDAFAAGRAAEWKALGGTWEVTNGMIRNDSDERGAKILTGSPYWRNYSIEADLMLLGNDGDAGLIMRSSKEEEGVDSYSGYYTGLRNHDNSLVLGRADHGWMENRKRIDLARGKIQPFQWYHLKFLAYGCHLISTVTNSSHQSVASMAIEDKECLTSGRIGLRSYSSGGVWKNVVVQEANESDLLAAMKNIPAVEAGSMQPTAVENAVSGLYSQAGEHESMGSEEGAPGPSATFACFHLPTRKAQP